ncbi:MAG: acyloxyacyl hydrolase [Chthoniobacterales bacterium]
MCATITAESRVREVGARAIDKGPRLAFHRAEMKKLLASCFMVFLSTLPAAFAGEEPVATTMAPQTESNYSRGATEFQNVTGAYFYFTTTDNRRPSVDFALNSTRFGLMLNDPWEMGPLSGNFEVLGELFGGGIFQGPGDVMAGATLIFRYNFVQPRARLVPYLQIGTGGVYTNIGEAESRGLISLPVEFNLQGIGGTRLMLSDRWSLVIEGSYRHISNAEIKKPNFGIDSIGGNVGFGFFF